MNVNCFSFAGQSVNASLLSPYLDSLGSSFESGANFAIVGSTTLPRYVPFALNIQVMQFKHFKDRSAELASIGITSSTMSKNINDTSTVPKHGIFETKNSVRLFYFQ